jgi:hypothetical protein
VRLQPLDSPSPQHLNGFISVDEFAALGLSKTLLYAGGYGFALVEHPVFQIKLFADDLERLVQHLGWILVGSRLDV